MLLALSVASGWEMQASHHTVLLVKFIDLNDAMYAVDSGLACGSGGAAVVANQSSPKVCNTPLNEILYGGDIPLRSTVVPLERF
jgi:tRNA1(Val) A37 N6-methylase TrmN6